MTVYVLTNNDSIIMGVFLTKRKADRMRIEIGQQRWHEAWIILPMKIDEIDKHMLIGCESYRRMLKKLGEQNEAARITAKT